MATTQLSSATLLLVLLSLLSSTVTSACGTCVPSPETPVLPSPETPVLPSPMPVAPKGPPANPFCPRDTLKLGACADLLGSININIGSPPSGDKCCALLKGLSDLEAAVCLCTALKADVLGINLNVPVELSVLVSACGKKIPTGFKCG